MIEEHTAFNLAPNHPSWWNSGEKTIEDLKFQLMRPDWFQLFWEDARLQIFHASDGGWLVTWNIDSNPRDRYFSGGVWMGHFELDAAFCLSSCYNFPQGRYLIEQYGAHTAFPGKFIRRGPWLNIPYPGTGFEGDPNISLFVTKEIESEVKNMLRSHPAPLCPVHRITAYGACSQCQRERA